MYTIVSCLLQFKSTSYILFTHILLSPLLLIFPLLSWRRWRPLLVSIWRTLRATIGDRGRRRDSRLPRCLGGECPAPLRAGAGRGGPCRSLWPGRRRRCQALRRDERPGHWESRGEWDRSRGRRVSHEPLLFECLTQNPTLLLANSCPLFRGVLWLR